MSTPSTGAAFRVGVVAGVTPDKWTRRWTERMPRVRLEMVRLDDDEQVAALRSGLVDMCFLRDVERQEGLHLVPLYDEVPVVVVGKEHPVAVFDEIDITDLAHETTFTGMAVGQAIDTVAAGTGIVILPMSVARAHQRKDVVAVPVRGAAGSSVGLGWLVAADDDRVETFVGIVRGRTARSSRGLDQEPAPDPGKVTKPSAAAGSGSRRRGGSSASRSRRDRRR